jgi:hypothetical protein
MRSSLQVATHVTRSQAKAHGLKITEVTGYLIQVFS